MPHKHTVNVIDDEAVSDLLFVEAANIPCRFFKHFDELRLDLLKRRIKLFGADLERVKLGFVEFAQVVVKRLVAVANNICDNLRNYALNVRGYVITGEYLAVWHFTVA